MELNCQYNSETQDYICEIPYMTEYTYNGESSYHFNVWTNGELFLSFTLWIWLLIWLIKGIWQMFFPQTVKIKRWWYVIFRHFRHYNFFPVGYYGQHIRSLGYVQDFWRLYLKNMTTETIMAIWLMSFGDYIYPLLAVLFLFALFLGVMYYIVR